MSQPMRFSNDRFRQYAADLSRAILELSIETKMADLPSDWIRNGAKLNDVSKQATNQLANPSPVNGEIIPPSKSIEPIKSSFIGASSLASLIRNQQEKIKAQFAKAGEDLVKVIAEGQELADAATSQVKAAKAEVADLKAALGLNSNGGQE